MRISCVEHFHSPAAEVWTDKEGIAVGRCPSIASIVLKYFQFDSAYIHFFHTLPLVFHLHSALVMSLPIFSATTSLASRICVCSFLPPLAVLVFHLSPWSRLRFNTSASIQGTINNGIIDSGQLFCLHYYAEPLWTSLHLPTFRPQRFGLELLTSLQGTVGKMFYPLM